jgi:hypothetical protein
MVNFDVHSSVVRFSGRLEHKTIIVEEKFGPSAKKTAFQKEFKRRLTFSTCTSVKICTVLFSLPKGFHKEKIEEKRHF